MLVRTVLFVIPAAALTAACAPTLGVKSPVPFPGAVAAPAKSPVAVPSAPIDFPRLVQTALALLGTPYQSGGDSPDTGFDCSGFVHFLFREQGWELPRTVREQFAYGRRIRERDIRSGDLLFFATESRGAAHVGIAVDPADAPAVRSGHPFIHAPGDNGAVRIDALESAYWKPRFLGARRLF
jgi:cell wall-associated NlpC family hydrolase